jgi:hypothetical protein
MTDRAPALQRFPFHCDPVHYHFCDLLEPSQLPLDILDVLLAFYELHIATIIYLPNNRNNILAKGRQHPIVKHDHRALPCAVFQKPYV